MSAKELREKRAALIASARKYHEENKGDWTADRQAAFDKMIDDAQELGKQAKSIEALEGHEKSLAEERERNPAPVVTKTGPTKPGDSGATDRVITRQGRDPETGRIRYAEVPAGRRGTAAYRQAFAESLVGNLSPERRANLRSDEDEKGGYLVASEQFAAGLLKEVDDLLFIRRNATVITVRDATTLGIRKRTTKMSTFNWGAELQTQANDTSLKFGKKVLTPHHLTGSIRVSRDNLRRNLLGAEAIVMEEMARDAAEVQEQAFLTGDGAGKPLGVFVASTDGISTARDVQTGSATSITANGLIDAKFLLKAQYRLPAGERSGARWLLHRNAIKIVAKLTEAVNGQYLWQPGLREGNPDILLGMPVDESEKVPNTFTTGLYVGLLAQWRYYNIADSLDMEIQTLDQLYAETNEVGYIGRLKNDGMPVLEEAFVRLITN